VTAWSPCRAVPGRELETPRPRTPGSVPMQLFSVPPGETGDRPSLKGHLLARRRDVHKRFEKCSTPMDSLILHHHPAPVMQTHTAVRTSLRPGTIKTRYCEIAPVAYAERSYPP
jgi:hypothetical protein